MLKIENILYEKLNEVNINVYFVIVFLKIIF